MNELVLQCLQERGPDAPVSPCGRDRQRKYPGVSSLIFPDRDADELIGCDSHNSRSVLAQREHRVRQIKRRPFRVRSDLLKQLNRSGVIGGVVGPYMPVGHGRLLSLVSLVRKYGSVTCRVVSTRVTTLAAARSPRRRLERSRVNQPAQAIQPRRGAVDGPRRGLTRGRDRCQRPRRGAFPTTRTSAAGRGKRDHDSFRTSSGPVLPGGDPRDVMFQRFSIEFSVASGMRPR